MMHEHGKSDSAIVAAKPTNKAGRPAAEPVERRAGTEGNAGQHSTRRAQYRESVSQALGHIRQIAKRALRRQTPEVGAVCGKSARTDLCGGRPVMDVPTAIPNFRSFDISARIRSRRLAMRQPWRRTSQIGYDC
jgi:hypothetical protein